MCIALNLPPLAFAALVSWIRHPGQPVTTMAAPVFSMFCTLLVEDRRRDVGVVHVKGPRPAAAHVGLFHLDEFACRLEKIARLFLDPLAPHRDGRGRDR